ncbi:hypothetical protein [Shinella sp. M31]|uniref:hypothetical protein n=1 Tax=Shinella sp. M31 TaxID=3368615 RepID=UPI003B9DEF34
MGGDKLAMTHTYFIEKRFHDEGEPLRLRLAVPRMDERYGTKNLLSSAIGDYLLSLGLLQECGNDPPLKRLTARSADAPALTD